MPFAECLGKKMRAKYHSYLVIKISSISVKQTALPQSCCQKVAKCILTGREKNKVTELYDNSTFDVVEIGPKGLPYN